MRKLWRRVLVFGIGLQVLIVALDLLDLLVFAETPSYRRIVHMEVATLVAYVLWARVWWSGP